MTLSQQYVRPLKLNVVVQLVLVFCVSIIMDGGACARVLIFAMAGYWGGVLLITCRRPRNPTNGDVTFVRAGIALALLISVGAISLMEFAGKALGLWR